MKLKAANDRISALGNTTRLVILKLLRVHSTGLSASAIAEKLEIPAPTLSFHMSQLEKTRLVSAKRHGRSLLYTINAGGLTELAQFLTEIIPGDTMQKTLKPVVAVSSRYLPLPCATCGEDLIPDAGRAIIAFAETFRREDRPKETHGVYVSHKGKCDQIMRAQWDNRETLTGWSELESFTSPPGFLRLLLTELNQRQRGDLYTEEAHKQFRDIAMSLSQLALREMSETERERFLEDRELDFMRS